MPFTNAKKENSVSLQLLVMLRSVRHSKLLAIMKVWISCHATLRQYVFTTATRSTVVPAVTCVSSALVVLRSVKWH